MSKKGKITKEQVFTKNDDGKLYTLDAQGNVVTVDRLLYAQMKKRPLWKRQGDWERSLSLLGGSAYVIALCVVAIGLMILAKGV